jgi:hypothetical protein
VTFDATGLFGGEYLVDLVVASNDPITPEVVVATTLQVTGAPDIDIGPLAIDFGLTFIGASPARAVSVSNVGTDLLTVTGVAVDHSDYSVDVTSFALNPGEDQEIVVTFAPTSSAVISANLTIESDDSDASVVVVSLTGEGIAPPVISVSPDTLAEALNTNEIAIQTLTITNGGEADLEWTVTAQPASWVTVDPVSGSVPGGTSTDLTVAFDATGLFGGDYLADLVVASNDPTTSEVVVPTTLHVTAVPDIVVDLLAIDFGLTFIGGSSASVVNVSNLGTDLLTVTGVSADHSDYSVDITSFALDPGGDQDIVVTFAPSSAGVIAGDLTIESDDLDDPIVVVSLTGEGIEPPVIAVSPDSLVKELPTGETSTRTVTIGNEGVADLEWDLGLRLVSTPASRTYMLTAPPGDPEEVDSGGSAAQPVGRSTSMPAILSDLTGVRILWDRSHNQADTGGWTTIISDLTLRGAEVIESIEPINQGYLATFDILWTIDSNSGWTQDNADAVAAWVQMGGALLLEGDNTASVPAFNLLLSTAGAGITYSTADGTGGPTTNVFPHQATAGVSMIQLQVGALAHLSSVVSPAGNLVNDATNVPAVAYSEVGSGRIVGMSDEIFSNSVIDLADNRLFAERVFGWLAAAAWLWVDPPSGTLPGSTSADVMVTFDATGLAGGAYEADIVVASNDPITPEVIVSTTLHVTGAVPVASVSLLPDTLGVDGAVSSIIARVVLPDGLDPRTVLPSTVGCLAVPAKSVTLDAVESRGRHSEITLEFDRLAVQRTRPNANEIELRITGKLEDGLLFEAVETLSVVRPRVQAPNGSETLLTGTVYPITWANPPGITPDHAEVYVSSHDASWLKIGTATTRSAFSWTVPSMPTETARIKIVAFDDRGELASDASDEVFAIIEGADAIGVSLPTVYALRPSAPNPFRTSTTIHFDLPADSPADLRIFDVSGRLVRVLASEGMPRGRHAVSWNGLDGHGQRTAPGVYFYRLKAGEFAATRRVVRLR